MKKITVEKIEKFKEYLVCEEKADATVEKYIRDIGFFREWLNGECVTKALVLEYKKELTEKYAPASVNAALSSLNSFFIYNEWYDCKVKALKIQRQIFAERSKELTKCEYERLLVAAKSRKNKRLYHLMQTICSCGIRVSELSAVTVDAVKNRTANINCKGKIRVVILPKELCRVLTDYIKEEKITSGPVFITKKGNPLDRSSIWKMMKDLCEDAGVEREKVFPHNLRHLFARTYYSIQKDIVRLADILGHSSVNTTRIYTMETSDVHRRQIQELGLLSI